WPRFFQAPEMVPQHWMRLHDKRLAIRPPGRGACPCGTGRWVPIVRGGRRADSLRLEGTRDDRSMAQPIRVPNPARETIHPPTRGRTPVAETSPWHVAPLLWGLFALSLLFLGAVRMYVSRIERVSF